MKPVSNLYVIGYYGPNGFAEVTMVLITCNKDVIEAGMVVQDPSTWKVEAERLWVVVWAT